jgi:hypothetical protein
MKALRPSALCEKLTYARGEASGDAETKSELPGIGTERYGSASSRAKDT